MNHSLDVINVESNQLEPRVIPQILQISRLFFSKKGKEKETISYLFMILMVLLHSIWTISNDNSNGQ